MSTTRENPYIGPKSFTYEDRKKFAGRDADITALYRLLIAERIVLLYSPSGAGKSSLVNAGLLPRMSEKGFKIFPVARVNQELPPELADSQANRYVFSLLQSLEESLPKEEHIPDAELATLTLNEYLVRRLLPAPNPEVESYEPRSLLIFDQFEEILTIDPENEEDRLAFFTQVGEALEESSRWALFVAREDYIAGLDPYLRLIPTRLAHTFRLDLLDLQTAQDAIRKPAKLVGVEYTEDATQKLVRDLSKVRIQLPDGSLQEGEHYGRYVEPVHLQVVCQRLWNKMGDTNTITADYVENLGDVNKALEDFYADQVREAAEKLKIPEKDIRTWFDDRLITATGIRSQVLLEENISGGLDNLAILYLANKSHLIRGEVRRGIRWYELAHDRLIDPVRRNNKAWFRNHLSALERRAMLWEEQGQPDSMLFRDDELAEAEEWAKSHEISPTEEAFLKKCIDLRAKLRAQKEADFQRHRAEELNKLNQELETSKNNLVKTNRSLRTRNLIAVGLFILALFVSGIAVIQWQSAVSSRNAAVTSANEAATQAAIAREEKAIAEVAKATAEAAQKSAEDAREAAEAAERDASNLSKISQAAGLAARASNLVDKNPSLAALLSIEALNVAVGSSEQYQPTAEQNLRDLLSQYHPYALSGHGADILQVLFTPDESLLITRDKDTIKFWRLAGSDPTNSNERKNVSEITSSGISEMAVSPDSRLLAVGFWDGDQAASVIALYSLSEGSLGEELTRFTVDPKGGEITALAFGTAGEKTWFAAGSLNGYVTLVDVSANSSFTPFQLVRGSTQVNALAFSQDGLWLAGGSDDGQVRIWEIAEPTRGPAQHSHTAEVQMLAYSADKRFLVAAGEEERIYIYNARQRSNKPYTLYNESGVRVRAIAFNPLKPGEVAVGYANGKIKIWDIASSANTPKIELTRYGDAINFLAYTPDGLWLLSAGRDRALRAWSATNLGLYRSANSNEPLTLKIFNGDITAFSLSQGGSWLAVGTRDNEVFLWDFRAGLKLTDPLRFGGPEERFLNPVFSPDSQWVAIQKQEIGRDQLTTSLWRTADFATGSRTPLIQELSDEYGFGLNAFSPDNRFLALGVSRAGSASIRLFDLQNLSDGPRILPLGRGPVGFVGFSPGAGRWLVSSDDTGLLRFWDTTNLDADPVTLQIPQYKDATSREVRYGLYFSPRGRWLSAVSFHDPSSDAVLVWDLEDLKHPPLTFPGSEGGIYWFDYSPDEKLLAIGTQPGFDAETDATANGSAYVIVLDSSPLTTFELPGHIGYVNHLSFEPSSRYLATGDDNGDIRIWDLSEGQATLAAEPIHYTDSWVVWVLFSPDGKWIASASADGNAGLWSTDFLQSGTNPAGSFLPLSGHLGPITTIAFSADGQWLATGSTDHTVRLWNLNYPRSEPVILRGMVAGVNALEFEPTSRFLVVNTELNEAQLWRLSLDELKVLACEFARRNLNAAEVEQYLPEGMTSTLTCPANPAP